MIYWKTAYKILSGDCWTFFSIKFAQDNFLFHSQIKTQHDWVYFWICHTNIFVVKLGQRSAQWSLEGELVSIDMETVMENIFTIHESSATAYLNCQSGVKALWMSLKTAPPRPNIQLGSREISDPLVSGVSSQPLQATSAHLAAFVQFSVIGIGMLM